MVAWVPFDIGEHGGLGKIKALFVLFGLTSVLVQFDKVRESRECLYIYCRALGVLEPISSILKLLKHD